MKLCPTCARSSPDAAKFCETCGTSLEHVASSLAAINAPLSTSFPPNPPASTPAPPSDTNAQRPSVITSSMFGLDVGAIVASPAPAEAPLPSVSVSRPASAAPSPAAAQSGSQASSGMATASLILGIFGLFFIWPAAVLALIFSYLARTEIRKNPALSGDGFAKAGLILGWIGAVIPPIALLIFFAWGIGRASTEMERVTEKVVFNNFVFLNQALARFRESCPQIGYPESLHPHVADSGATEEVDCTESSLAVSSILWPNYNNYNFQYRSEDSDGDAVQDAYFIRATPTASLFGGKRHFFTDHSTIIRWSLNSPATAQSAPAPGDAFPSDVAASSDPVENEEAAIEALRSYHSALLEYQRLYPAEGFPSDHQHVLIKENTPVGPTAAGLLDPGQLDQGGYTFSYEVEDRKPGNPRFDSYRLFADPPGAFASQSLTEPPPQNRLPGRDEPASSSPGTSGSSGRRFFVIDESGVIRWARGSRPTASSHKLD